MTAPVKGKKRPRPTETKVPCVVCGKPILVLTASANAEEVSKLEMRCGDCLSLSERYGEVQKALRALAPSLPGDAEMGAILRRRLLAYIAMASDEELGAFYRLILEGSVEGLAEYSAALAQRLQN